MWQRSNTLRVLWPVWAEIGGYLVSTGVSARPPHSDQEPS
jgi:hypothetical protein